MIPSLWRIGRSLESLVHALESGEVSMEPGQLNRLARTIHGLGQCFSSPLFRLGLLRIERQNLRLASFAENVYVAGHPQLRTLMPVESVFGFGPGSETGSAMSAFLRSA